MIEVVVAGMWQEEEVCGFVMVWPIRSTIGRVGMELPHSMHSIGMERSHGCCAHRQSRQ
jgi:hypothetical protein